MAIMSACKTRHILIIKLAALGDAVMASSMLTAIRSRWPEAHITWLCGNSIAPLVRLFEDVDELLTVDDKLLLSGPLPAKLRTLVSTACRLAGRSFDLCLLGHSDWRYRLIPILARCSVRRGFGKRNGPIPGRWHGTEYARLALGGDGSITMLAELARLRLPSEQPAIDKVAHPVILVPGGAQNIMRDDGLRRWPVAHYRALAEALLMRGIGVSLIGAPSDLWVEDAFTGLTVTSHIGKTDVFALLKLLSQARGCVTHDTGPMHLAYLMGTPTVALFGPTLAMEKTPAMAHVRVLSADMSCAPCYDGRNYAQCTDPICMRSVSPKSVLASLLKLLADTVDAV